MVRLVVLALIAVLVYLLLRVLLRLVAAGLPGAGPGRAGRPALRDDLVKDPVCETWVPRRVAVTRVAGQTTYYFCSRACADRFTGQA